MTAAIEAAIAGVEGMTAAIEATIAGREGMTAAIEATIAGREGMTAAIEATIAGMEGMTAGIEATTRGIEPMTATIEPTTRVIEPMPLAIEPTTASMAPMPVAIEPMTATSAPTVAAGAWNSAIFRGEGTAIELTALCTGPTTLPDSSVGARFCLVDEALDDERAPVRETRRSSSTAVPALHAKPGPTDDPDGALPSTVLRAVRNFLVLTNLVPSLIRTAHTDTHTVSTYPHLIGNHMKIQLISFVAAASIVACGAAPGAEDGTGSSSEAVSALPDLTGSYTGGSEAQFAAIELDPSTNAKGQYTYFLDEQGGIVSCVVGKGCTVTHERETGYYSATATHLTLHPSNGAERVYSYVHTGTALTLTRDGATGTYAQVESYCDTAADCPAEGLIHPDCASATSGWECSATHLCSYACSGAK